MPMTIRRSHLLEDALSQIPRSGESLKRRLFVTFINEQGLQVGLQGRFYNIMDLYELGTGGIWRGVSHACKKGGGALATCICSLALGL